MTNWRPSRKRSLPAKSEHSLREVATFGTSALQLGREAYATLEAMQPPFCPPVAGATGAGHGR